MVYCKICNNEILNKSASDKIFSKKKNDFIYLHHKCKYEQGISERDESIKLLKQKLNKERMRKNTLAHKFFSQLCKRIKLNDFDRKSFYGKIKKELFDDFEVKLNMDWSKMK
jgi:hypothetical protein